MLALKRRTIEFRRITIVSLNAKSNGLLIVGITKVGILQSVHTAHVLVSLKSVYSIVCVSSEDIRRRVIYIYVAVVPARTNQD